ncbi:MAG: hypothetical protein LIP00_02755 [Parabacteroides sp.]|nr:hypothetical protein [Parabacteroides sp.]
MKNILRITLLLLFPLSGIAVSNGLRMAVPAATQLPVERDSTYRNDGSLWKVNEYADGKVVKRTTYDKQGRIYDITPYRDGEPYGWSESWDYDDDSYSRCFFKGYGSPRIRDKYSVWEDQKGLARRIVQDENGCETHSFYKPDCDSTQTTVTGTHIELRDYKDGRLRALERYTLDLIPDGVFESYHPSGEIVGRQLFEQGRLVNDAFYDYDGKLRPDKAVTQNTTVDSPDGETGAGIPDGLKVTRLTQGRYGTSLFQSRDSKQLSHCLESGRDLVIRNAAGDVLLERHSTDDDIKYFDNGYGGVLNFAYYGYDKNVGLHLGFSSYGDYNDVRFFVVPEQASAPADSEGEYNYIELAAESISIHETTGRIAAISGIYTTGNDGQGGNTDGSASGLYQTATRNYSLVGFRWDGMNFIPGFDFTVELPDGSPEITWVGDNSLLARFSDEVSYLIEIDPDRLESACPPEEEGDI